MDPHFIIGTLDFLSGLQTSRLRFDVKWMLGAVKEWSGIPPAVIVQVTIDASRPKWGLGMGSFGSPCFLFSARFQESAKPVVNFGSMSIVGVEPK